MIISFDTIKGTWLYLYLQKNIVANGWRRAKPLLWVGIYRLDSFIANSIILSEILNPLSFNASKYELTFAI